MAELPRLVAVETTSRCNAKCVFCPNSALRRDRHAMAGELFEKIVEECGEFPLRAIEPFLQGEPFCDPEIVPRLEHIRRRLPRARLRLYTNGYAMGPKHVDALAGLGVDHLYVSLNTLDEGKYRQAMGLELGRTLANLDYLTDPRRRGRVARRITFRMTRLGDTSLAEQDRFLAYCRARGVRPFIVGLFNYKGDVCSTLPVPRYGCEHVHRLDILATGRVALCCMDQDGEYGWGDAREQSVLDLFRHPTARRYREMHTSGRRRSIEPCGACNNFWPGFRGMGIARALRTGLEYGAYRLACRPIGRKAPAGPSGETLAELRGRCEAAVGTAERTRAHAQDRG
ncbi:MAG: radical SAM protein [Deltaproteobacteria bacterium]|nr:radical SAM protein [Deltaproteobacteria bacterium]